MLSSPVFTKLTKRGTLQLGGFWSRKKLPDTWSRILTLLDLEMYSPSFWVSNSAVRWDYGITVTVGITVWDYVWDYGDSCIFPCCGSLASGLCPRPRGNRLPVHPRRAAPGGKTQAQSNDETPHRKKEQGAKHNSREGDLWINGTAFPKSDENQDGFEDIESDVERRPGFGRKRVR